MIETYCYNHLDAVLHQALCIQVVINKCTVCRMIETYCPAVHDELVKIGVNSKGGRGGMTAKMQAAWMAAQQGVTTVIANGKASDSLLQVRY